MRQVSLASLGRSGFVLTSQGTGKKGFLYGWEVFVVWIAELPCDRSLRRTWCIENVCSVLLFQYLVFSHFLIICVFKSMPKICQFYYVDLWKKKIFGTVCCLVLRISLP